MALEERRKEMKKNETRWNWKLLPLQFVLLLLPLILYMYKFQSGFSAYNWNSMDDTYYDIFLHGKMVAFQIVAAVTLGLAVWKLIKLEPEKRKQSLRYFIPILLYLCFVILSTIFSDNIMYSLTGSMDAKEPLGVLAGYVIVAFYAYIAVENLQDVISLTTAAVFGSCGMVFVGIMQTIGKDVLALEGVQRLIASKEILEVIDQYGPFHLTFPVGQAYGTLFNPNYVGTYVAMYVPLVLIGVVLYKQWWKKMVCGTAFVGLLVMLFASQSRTGLIAIVAVIAMLVIFLGRELLKRWYIVVPALVVVVVGFLVLDASRNHLLTERLKEMFALQASEDSVSGVDTTGQGVRVLYKDTEFTVQMEVVGGSFAYVVSENGQAKTVTYNEDGSYGYVTLSNGDEIAIQTATYENKYAFGIVINNRNFYFTNQLTEGDYKYINTEIGRLDECVIPANVFPGYEAVASGRGYVWGRTIPLLLNNFVVGSGPDTFTIVFPQNDYVARYKSGFDNVIFTRPHNFYLQIGVQTGVLSLIAFLVFYGIYFVGCCRRYFVKKFNGMEQWIGFAVFLCTVGFMVSGLANDSLIVVTPVFYVLLGMGMMINHKLCPVMPKETKQKDGK